MAEEQRLQPLIQQAYGTGVQATDISGITDYFGKEVKRKREDYRSALEIGDDLSEKYYSTIEKDLGSILDEVQSGNLDVGSPQWSRQVNSFRKKAMQAKQLQDQFETRQELFLEKPDETAFYEEIDGQIVDTGFEGFMRNWDSMLDKEYDNFGEMVNEHATTLQRMEVLPQGPVKAFQGLRKDARLVSGDLLKGAGATRKSTYSFPARGNLQITTTTTLNDDGTKAAVESLLDQYETPLRAYYRRIPIDQRQGLTENEYVEQTIQDMLVTSSVDVEGERYSVKDTDDKESSFSLSKVRGGYQNDDYFFAVTDAPQDIEIPETPRERQSIRFRRQINGTVDVTGLTKGETNKIFNTPKGTPSVEGKLDDISIRDGEIRLLIKTSQSQDDADIPYKGNEDKVARFYGITEDDIYEMVLKEGLGASATGKTSRQQEVRGSQSTQQEGFLNPQ